MYYVCVLNKIAEGHCILNFGLRRTLCILEREIVLTTRREGLLICCNLYFNAANDINTNCSV
jgi:hypothetical protein